MFGFVIGCEKESSKIHSGAIAAQSNILQNLVNGPRIDIQIGRVWWENVTVDTFTRFV